MGLATAKVGLELHDRITALASEPLHGADQQLFEAFGEIGAAEELDGLAIFVAAFAHVDCQRSAANSACW